MHEEQKPALPKFGVMSPDGAGGYQVTGLTRDQKDAKAGAAAITGAYWIGINAHEVKVPKPPKMTADDA